MRRPGATTLAALVLAAAGEAQAAPPYRPPAHEIATDPEHPAPFIGDGRPSFSSGSRRGRRGRSDTTVGAAMTGGRARQKYSPDGQFARLALRVMVHDHDDAEPVAAVEPLAIDAWRAPASGSWGFSMPMAVGLGYATPHFIGFGSIGWAAFSVDHERDKTGFGLWSPLAGVSAGISVDPVRILFDARAIYRWHIKTVDTPQTQVGVTLELFTRP